MKINLSLLSYKQTPLLFEYYKAKKKLCDIMSMEILNDDLINQFFGILPYFLNFPKVTTRQVKLSPP